MDILVSSHPFSKGLWAVPRLLRYGLALYSEILPYDHKKLFNPLRFQQPNYFWYGLNIAENDVEQFKICSITGC
jgi:hypothetical protein